MNGNRFLMSRISKSYKNKSKLVRIQSKKDPISKFIDENKSPEELYPNYIEWYSFRTRNPELYSQIINHPMYWQAYNDYFWPLPNIRLIFRHYINKLIYL